jgi:hypothetical protein
MRDNPQIILICCEGKKTEKPYFEILQRIFRIDIMIQILPKEGQNYRLIDNSVTKKQKLSLDCDFVPDDIEVWAVCDRDDLKDSFTELHEYAADKGVDLAFSDPQFENYLLQHFGSPNNSRKKRLEVERELTSVLREHGIEVVYDKSNLDWLASMIDKKPRLVDEAVRHANIYSVHTKQPFFTIQRLTERILSFRI